MSARCLPRPGWRGPAGVGRRWCNGRSVTARRLIGVRAEQLKEYLGHDAATLDPGELKDLRALYAAIRDGEASWRDVMEAKTGESSKKSGTTSMKDLKAKAAKTDPEPQPAFDLEPILQLIAAATDVDALDLIADGFTDAPDEHYDALKKAYGNRRAELQPE